MSNRDLVDFSGRAVSAVQNQEFPWTFPLWFTDMQIKDLATFAGRDLSDG